MATGCESYEGKATESAEAPKITVREGGILVLSEATVDLLGDAARGGSESGR